MKGQSSDEEEDQEEDDENEVSEDDDADVEDDDDSQWSSNNWSCLTVPYMYISLRFLLTPVTSALFWYQLVTSRWRHLLDVNCYMVLILRFKIFLVQNLLMESINC